MRLSSFYCRTFTYHDFIHVSYKMADNQSPVYCSRMLWSERNIMVLIQSTFWTIKLQQPLQITYFKCALKEARL